MRLIRIENTMQDLVENQQFLSGGGEMGALIRSMDWGKTALGPVDNWPQSLRTTVSLCLSSTFPILIAWGPELIQIYNDSYRPICGAKHPQAMGQNFKICWETALPVVGDAFDRGLAGEGTYIKDQQMLLDRYGYIEEAFMTFSFAPIRDESGDVGGIFHPITETTEQILSARRTQVLRDLAVHIGKAKSIEQICEQLLKAHPAFIYDLPFIQLYELSEKADNAKLKTSSGITGDALVWPVIDTTRPGGEAWPFFEVLETGSPQRVENLQVHFGEFGSGPFEEQPHTALIFPVLIGGRQKPYGFMVAGVSSARALDQEYENFFELLANTVSTAFSNVDAYQEQQKRAQQLAEIDEAKTAFFSNVSHEFRTPLTLILGPLQELMEKPQPEQRIQREDVETMNRNALRLLKLVNNLLDFSRTEAGRVKAVFESVNLGALTADLASNFRSVIESAGMELAIQEPYLTAPVYVDRDMWEKIVLNLLSNAFKYTLKGTITVSVSEKDGQACLQVCDTGVGIPESELPHMFERFHRVENSLGRTHEGTGIGLSLIRELIHLHHGTISVASELGKGSVFTVLIPLGDDHLKSEQIVNQRDRQQASAERQTFVREAMSLLAPTEAETVTAAGDDDVSQDDPGMEVQKDVRVLIVDDNADMRFYLGRLLSVYFTVDYAVNGEDGIEKARINTPDLIISDIMMPVMDGRQMLMHFREVRVQHIPVILLSARAGEESRIEGLDWGADDYLVKPFSARELLTKVNALIRVNAVRKKTESELRNIFHQAPVAIGIFRGHEQVIEVANNLMLTYWGKTSEQVVGLPYLSAFKRAPSDGLDVIAHEVLVSGKSRILREWPLNISRGSRSKKLYINLSLEPLKNLDGTVTGVMVVANDVTELITALEFIRESESRFRVLANSMPLLVWRIDRAGGKNFYNEFTIHYSGLSQEELLEGGLISIVHPDDRSDNMKAWQQAMRTGEDFTYKHRYRRHDGEYRWHLSRGIAQRAESGEITSWVGTSTDIHDQKTQQETLERHVSMRTAELVKSNEMLIKTNRELEQFAYITSHDLQEPLRKIQVFSGLIKQYTSGSDNKTLDYLERVISSSKRMSALINDLLSYSRIVNSDSRFNEVDLNQVLANVKSDLELSIQQKEARIVSDRLPVIEAVPLHMNQLFYNMLSNGLKFTREQPRIDITYRAIEAGETPEHNFLQPFTKYALVTFNDEGIGFDEQFADRIFTIFQRLNSARDFEGTGIGLSICKKIVEAHNGHIVAGCKENKGASFEVYLPFSQAN